jgi:hypothetical protein
VASDYSEDMVTELNLGPELAEAVDRGRKLLADMGVWPSRAPVRPLAPTIPPDAAKALLDWKRDGGYDDAVARIGAEDPDLADQ